MKKRIAFLGLSYPLMFDSTRNVKSWMGNQPDLPGHPVIGGANGLLIMYDEIWFLSKKLCPISMQRYPFIKYVDEMNLAIRYELINQAVDICNKPGAVTDRPLSVMPYTTEEIRQFLNLPYSVTGYTEFTGVSVGKYSYDTGPSRRNYLIDFLIVKELQRLTKNSYELVSNINIPWSHAIDASDTVEFVHQLMVDRIPDVIEQYGPFSPGIEELRGNKYLSDFRKWIIENHDHLQKAEVKEMKESIQHQVDAYRNEVFLREAEKGSLKNIFLSTAKNGFDTFVGYVPGVGEVISLAGGVINQGNIVFDGWNSNKNRWMAFMVSTEGMAERYRRS